MGVVLHFVPDYDSKLAEVLQTVTTIPVSRVTYRRPSNPITCMRFSNKIIEVFDNALL